MEVALGLDAIIHELNTLLNSVSLTNRLGKS
jgi:hypothetical protein